MSGKGRRSGSWNGPLTAQERQAEYSRTMALLARRFSEGDTDEDWAEGSADEGCGSEDNRERAVCVGRIVFAEPLPKEPRSAYHLVIDFGPALGVRHSLFNRADRYTRESLMGRLVLAAVGLPEQRDAGFSWDSLPLFLPDPTGAAILMIPERDVPLGTRLFGSMRGTDGRAGAS